MSIFVFGIESAPILARKVSDAAVAEKFVEYLAMASSMLTSGPTAPSGADHHRRRYASRARHARRAPHSASD
jgi:hypothetical protein